MILPPPSFSQRLGLFVQCFRCHTYFFSLLSSDVETIPFALPQSALLLFTCVVPCALLDSFFLVSARTIDWQIRCQQSEDSPTEVHGALM